MDGCEMSDQPAPPRVPTAIDCERAARRLWDFIDGGLPLVAREEVDMHLTTCELCARRFAFARTIKDELAKLGDSCFGCPQASVGV